MTPARQEPPQSSEASLPYPEKDGTRTGGWSGAISSQERAVRDARTGRVRERQASVMAYMEQRKYMGVTHKDLTDHFQWHHGVTSGALSNLHGAGRIHRLALSREGSRIYVLPEFVGGRRVEEKTNRDKPPTVSPDGEVCCPNCNTKFAVGRLSE